MRETEILVEQQPPQGVLVCDHAGRVINKFSQVHFSRDVVGVAGGETATPRLLFAGSGNECALEGEEFDLIIGADGGKSTIRPFVTDQTPSYSGSVSLLLQRVVCERDPDPRSTITPAGSLSTWSCWSCNS